MREPTPTLALPVSWLPTLTIMVPRKDAPLPQMSKRPKYSPDFSGGMIFAKWERLSAAAPPWEHAHDDGQHPELPLLGQEKRKHRDARVGRDAHRDELCRGVLVRQPPKDEGRRERHDLGHKKCQQKAGGVQTQRRAVGRRHVDNGVHAVDVAEERQQKPEHLFILRQMPQGVADAGKTLPDSVLSTSHSGAVYNFSAAAGS